MEAVVNVQAILLTGYRRWPSLQTLAHFFTNM